MVYLGRFEIPGISALFVLIPAYFRSPVGPRIRSSWGGFVEGFGGFGEDFGGVRMGFRRISAGFLWHS